MSANASIAVEASISSRSINLELRLRGVRALLGCGGVESVTAAGAAGGVGTGVKSGRAIGAVGATATVGTDGVPYTTVPSGARMKSADRKSTRLNSSHVSISYAVF